MSSKAQQYTGRLYTQAEVDRLVREARQEPVGAALEIKVAPRTMRYVLSKIRLKRKTIADRVDVQEWLVDRWADGTGDKYDYEVEMWRLRLLARLTRRFNWAVFLLKPDNIPELSKEDV